MLDVKSLDGGLVTRKFCFRVKTLTTATAVVGGGAIALGVSYLADGDRFSERIFLALLVSLLGVSLLGVSLYFSDQVRKGQNKQLALHVEHIRRLLVFNSLRAEASRLIFQSEDEDEFFSLICSLVVQHANLSLAWIGVPNEHGRFDFVASAGPAMGYLDGLEISIDQSEPEGMGSVGQCWRAKQVIFAADYEENGILAPWKARANKYGLKYNSVLPIYRSSSIYAVLALYVDSEYSFDPELQDLLVELAADLSFGLDWMSTIDRVELLGQALESLSEGVCVSDDHGVVIFVNGAFTQITGYEQNDVLGSDLNILQGAGSDPETRMKIRTALDAGEPGNFEILNYRKDGVPFWNSLAITPLVNTKGVITHLIVSMRDTTKRKELEIELEKTNIFSQALLDGMTVGLSIIRYPERQVEYVNDKALEIFGATEVSELQGHFSGEFFPDDATRYLVASFSESVFQGDRGVLKSLQYQKVDGTTGWMDMSGENLDQGDGHRRIIWTHVDIGERHKDEAKILDLSNMRKALLSSTVVAIGMVQYPERIYVEVNQAFLDILGYSSFEEVVGKVSKFVYPDNIEYGRMGALADEVFRNRAGSLSDLRVLSKNGGMKYVDIHGRLLEEDDSEHHIVVWTIVDVTDRHHLTEELERQALFDALTDLPNRRLLEDNLKLAISRSKRSASTVAVGLIDLDDFKSVNDRFGHEVGDDLLRQLANRFRDLLRNTDLLVRLGGDEFVIVVEDLDEFQIKEQLDAIFSHLYRAIELPFDLGDGRIVKVGMSMGVALYPGDAQDPDALLRMADFAMYQIKARKPSSADWWRLASFFRGAQGAGEDIDPFVAEEHLALSLILSQAEEEISLFVDTFYHELVLADEQVASGGATATPQAISFVRRQEEKLRLLLSPNATEADIVREANFSGTVHALIGISGSAASKAYSAFRGQLAVRLEASEISSRSRDLALKVMDSRLLILVHSELEAMQEVLEAYDQYLARSLSETVDDPESLIALELEALADLPGIVNCSLFRLESDGSFQLQLYRQKANAQDVQPLMDALALTLTDRPTPADSPTSRTWRSGSIEDLDTLFFEQADVGFRELFERSGIKGGISISLGDEQGVRYTLAIGTSCSRQFSVGSSRSITLALQGRWERLVGLLAQPGQPSSQDIVRYGELFLSDPLEIFMQPIVDLSTGAVQKFEALARLRDGGGRIVRPRNLLSTLRETELEALFKKELETGLNWLRRWHGDGHDFDLSINLAPATLKRSEVTRWIIEQLGSYGVQPHRLTVELLEDQDLDEIRDNEPFNSLLKAGVKLSIGDMGAGYSSLRHIVGLPFELVRVNEAIVKEISSEPIKTLGVIRTVIEMGKDFFHDVVVDGIDHDPVLEAVSVLGAKYGQGHTLASPMPPERVGEWLRSRSWAGADPRRLGYFLGALAYNWEYLHAGNFLSRTSFLECPISEFLIDKGYGKTEAEQWHKEMHDSFEVATRRHSASNFMDWLSGEVYKEAKLFENNEPKLQ